MECTSMISSSSHFGYNAVPPCATSLHQWRCVYDKSGASYHCSAKRTYSIISVRFELLVRVDFRSALPPLAMLWIYFDIDVINNWHRLIYAGGGFPAARTVPEQIAVSHAALGEREGTMESPVTAPLIVEVPIRLVDAKSNKWNI